MKTTLAIAAVLGIGLLAVIPTATSLPAPQVPLRAPEPPAQHFFDSNLLQGEDVHSVLRDVALELNQGIPDGWTRFTHSPVTDGSSGIEMVAADNLKSTMLNWGLDSRVLDQTYDNVETHIQLAISKAVYLAQGLSYNWSYCQDGGGHHTCLSTLVIVVKVPSVSGDGPWKAEVGHIYMSSTAKPVQEYGPLRDCNPMGGLIRCSSYWHPKYLTIQELEIVKTVMSTFQAIWALNQLSEPQTSDFSMTTNPDFPPHCPSFECPHQPSQFYSLLQHFHGNSVENGDVHRVYRGMGLLAAIQNAAISNRRVFRNMQPTVGEEGVVPLLEDKLGDCFKKAGITESLDDWWKRVYVVGRGDIVSLECESVRQRTVFVEPPRMGCINSADVTADTAYIWAMIAPRNDIFDVMFIEGELSVAFEDCRPRNGDSQDYEGLIQTMRIPLDVHESGSIVRWAYVDPHDGSFRSLQNLAEWESYPSYGSKVLLGCLRYASASSYLGFPLDKKLPALLQPYHVLDGADATATASVEMNPNFEVLLESIRKFAKMWGEVVEGVGSAVNTNVQRRVCLGFDALDYKANTNVFKAIPIKNIPLLVEYVADMEDLPQHEDVKRLMSGVKYSTNITWVAESMTFTNPAGEQSYFFFAKYGGDGSTGKADVVYSSVKSKFVLAPDMLVLHRQSSSFWGLFGNEGTYIEYVPHTLTLNDTLVLEMFWEMIAFRQIAISLGAGPLPSPDLTGLCNRTIP
ncbi:hypothetical protein BGZ96_002934 [Linnemannia gamsii]|uniref:Uncharacterized protein n=1 Tax=Linnemannia gamsii TaxID=64522 RepID=A0ABQ7K898_9FUNG|nr:hypothetical protein BGZ96_002934 [Linnemannia gamsii]